MKIKLSDVCTKITKGTTPTTLGMPFTLFGVNFVKSESITAIRELDRMKYAFIGAETHEKLKRSQLEENDILFSMAGFYLGKTAIVQRDDLPANTNQAVAIIRVDESKADYNYIYYALSNRSIMQYVSSSVAQSAQPNFSLKQIGDLELDLWPMVVQKSISATLSALDDKIANNTKINNNLEQMAQTIFKSWFVDFEPFGGVMPDNWQEVNLGDLCITITKGTTPTTLKRQFTEQGINFVKAESILDDHSIDYGKLAFIDDETNALLSRSVIHSDDIIFTIAGTLGRFSFVRDDLLPANTNQAVAIIRADKSKINPIALYSFFVGGLHSEFYTKNTQQAVQANLSLTTIKALPLFLPPQKTLLEYTALTEPLLKMIFHNHAENRNLANFRDSILPRLMSG